MAKATQKTAPTALQSTVDPAERDKFAALAADWWNPRGPMAPLHRLGPVRMAYLRDQLCAHFGRDMQQRQPLTGLKILDLGCGAGLVSEPLARLGAQVTGIDAAPENIAIARAHARESALEIDYQVGTAEAMASRRPAARFDAVVSLEVIEHVADPALYLGSIARLLGGRRPAPGLFLFSTPNRTGKSWFSVILGAERILRWLPPGTHDWKRFLTPEEFADLAARAGLAITDLRGLSYDLLPARFRLSDDVSVNYIGAAQLA